MDLTTTSPNLCRDHWDSSKDWSFVPDLQRAPTFDSQPAQLPEHCSWPLALKRPREKPNTIATLESSLIWCYSTNGMIQWDTRPVVCPGWPWVQFLHPIWSPEPCQEWSTSTEPGISPGTAATKPNQTKPPKTKPKIQKWGWKWNPKFILEGGVCPL